MNNFLTLWIILALFITCGTSQNQSVEEEIPIQKIITQKSYKFAWQPTYLIDDALANRIPCPDGAQRIQQATNSFGDWLRHLPLLPENSSVMLYDGSKKNNQNAHHAVFQIDVGDKDLQQCADAVMRLYAEYKWSTQTHEELAFQFTSGHQCKWDDWKKGFRPKIKGNQVDFIQTAQFDDSYSNFKSYLTTIFTYCGTYSLNQQLNTKYINELSAGDVFIKGGFPGHAVIVVDVAENSETKERYFLLAQSYMPAQQIHLLKNPNNSSLSPWYSTTFVEHLITPEWTFQKNQLRSF